MRRSRAGALGVVVALGLGACTSDATPVPDDRTTTTLAAASDLDDALLTAADLPEGFEPAAGDDTITTFCAGQDAAAGLRATARQVVAFARDPAGMSVIQVVLRLPDGGAERFVEQAEALLESCSEVPDGSGLAFAYEPASAPVAAALAGSDASISGYGTSVGSGTLTVEIGVVRRDDVAVLVAVLGVDQTRADLDALAARVFASTVAGLPAP